MLSYQIYIRKEIKYNNKGIRENMQNQDIYQDLLVEVYQQSIKASYFGGMTNEEFTKKSRKQIEEIKQTQSQIINEKTFLIKRNFQSTRPIQKIHKSGKVNIESPRTGFFCCTSQSSRQLSAQLIDRKFSLKNGQEIVYYVDFDAVSVTLDERRGKIYIFFEGLPQENRIKFALQKDSQQQRKSWMYLLNKAIQEGAAYKNHYTYLSRTCPQFYTQQQISVPQFQKYANTGDILLFRSPHAAARAQRLITKSQYDHVGVVLRNANDQLLIFQSSSYEGVGMYPWKHMIAYTWYDQCQKIAWKHLTSDLTDQQVGVVERFVKKTLGKKFQINLNKLVQNTSKLQRTQQQEEKKTYFCSELAARLYKELNLLESDRSSASYYPFDFSDKGNLKLLNSNFKLENEKIIAFETSNVKSKVN